MKQIKIKLLSPMAVTPSRGTPDSAGLDLYACTESPILIPARGRARIPIGVAVELESGTAGFVFVRSGHGVKHGLSPSNAVGVIDSDYRGEIVVSLTNNSDEDYIVQPGERVAQLVVMPVLTPEPVEAQILSDSPRGGRGFGSTGK